MSLRITELQRCCLKHRFRIAEFRRLPPKTQSVVIKLQVEKKSTKNSCIFNSLALC